MALSSASRISGSTQTGYSLGMWPGASGDPIGDSCKLDERSRTWRWVSAQESAGLAAAGGLGRGRSVWGWGSTEVGLSRRRLRLHPRKLEEARSLDFQTQAPDSSASTVSQPALVLGAAHQMQLPVPSLPSCPPLPQAPVCLCLAVQDPRCFLASAG